MDIYPKWICYSRSLAWKVVGFIVFGLLTFYCSPIFFFIWFALFALTGWQLQEDRWRFDEQRRKNVNQQYGVR
jgi:hypothetical protein